MFDDLSFAEAAVPVAAAIVGFIIVRALLAEKEQSEGQQAEPSAPIQNMDSSAEQSPPERSRQQDKPP